MFGVFISVAFISLVSSELLIIAPDNSTEMVMVDLELQFTTSLPEDGLMGQIVMANPEEACEPISPPPFPANSSLKWFVLIRRCSCVLKEKVHYAQEAGFDGVVIYNVGAKCQSTNNHSAFSSDPKIMIPGVLIGESDGKQINRSYQYENGYVIVINPESPFNLNNYLLPFTISIGISFIVMLTFLIVKCVEYRRRNMRNRLASRYLKQLPTKKFKKGDEYDVCAVCLEEYCEGEKLRILPCAHAYHTKCIDPWLTNNRRTCPVCKRNVALKGVTPDSDSDSDDESPSERTPLIRPERNNGGHTNGGTFSGSIATRSHSDGDLHRSDCQSDESTDTGSEEMYQSAVCQQSPPHEDEDVASSSSQLMAPTAHSINSEDGFQSGSSTQPSYQVAVHVQTPEGGNGKKRKQEMVV